MSDATKVFPFVDAQVTDNGHLETVRMTLQEPVRTPGALSTLVQQSPSIAVHGQRHSQGGQSLMNDAVSVDLDLLQDVRIERVDGQEHPVATVHAGATWDRVHQALVRYGSAGHGHFAPLTHQSSAYFSVGGSLAVNCHGRDPRQGPVADSVLGLHYMKGDGSTAWVHRDGAPVPAEMYTLLGGYGTGAVILEAQLKLKPEAVLKLQYDTYSSVEKYCHRMLQFMGEPQIEGPKHHYAWLSCGDDELMTSVVSVEGIEQAAGNHYNDKLEEENLLTDDMLSAIYQKYRLSSVQDIGEAWPELIEQIRLFSGGIKRQLNAMRAPVRFTQSQPYAAAPVSGAREKQVDLMQEYFVPPENLAAFINEARTNLQDAQRQGYLKVLNSTARALQRDSTTMLNYASSGQRCSLVINFSTPWALAQGFEQAGNPLTAVLRKLIDLAIAKGGAYYPCYGRFASLDQFKSAFGDDRVQEMVAQRRRLDPDKRFNNKFLETYLSF